jgi:hypothetical protein
VGDARGPLGEALAGRCPARSPTPFRCCFMALAGVVSEAVGSLAVQRRDGPRLGHGAGPLCSVMEEGSPRLQGETRSGGALQLRLHGGAGSWALSRRTARADDPPPLRLLQDATKAVRTCWGPWWSGRLRACRAESPVAHRAAPCRQSASSSCSRSIHCGQPSHSSSWSRSQSRTRHTAR